MSDATINYDPSETVRGVRQLLISDKKKIAFFFGAGTSFANRSVGMPYVPMISEMTEKVATEIGKNERYSSALAEIKAELKDTPAGFNVEPLLSNVEDKIRIIGAGSLNALGKSDFEELEKLIKKVIVREVSVHTHEGFDNHGAKRLPQYDFARWIKATDRKHAVEIFTTNYDYLIELGLEASEVPYYNGFTGSYEPFFNADSLEDMDYLPQQTKLWKIHGSLGLSVSKSTYTDGVKIIRKNTSSDNLLIYPSMLKYSNSKKLPYAAYMDRLYNFLREDDAVLFVCGYSFGDEHINERMLSALSSNTTSCVFALYYDVVGGEEGKEYMLTKDSRPAQIAVTNGRISVLGMRNAVIGSKYGTWRLKREPDKDDSLKVSLFFDEDAPFSDIEMNQGHKGDELWTGEGEFRLPDFIHFVRFLKEMILDYEWKKGETADNG